MSVEFIEKQNLTNIEFIAKSIYDIHLNEQEFDVVFFKASLHHFDKIDSFLANRIKPLISLPTDVLLEVYDLLNITNQMNLYEIAQLIKVAKIMLNLKR